MSTKSEGRKTARGQSLPVGTNNSGDGSKSVSTTGEGFEAKAYQNGILNAPRSGKYPVEDSEVKEKLLARRGSTSPTQSQYNKFADRISASSNEQGTIRLYSEYIFQHSEDAYFHTGYRIKDDEIWTEFPKNVGFNDGLSAPQPDTIEGFSRDSFPPTINYIAASRLVKNDPDYIALPHVAVEYESKEKGLHEARVQAGYDGAAMVYGRNEALRFIGKPDPPRQPAVVTAVASGHDWNIFAHYAHPNESTGMEEYYQHRMAGGFMDNLDEYKRGRRALRNMQDFARERSSDLRDSMREQYEEDGSW